jgi:hypothetical protein
MGVSSGVKTPEEEAGFMSELKSLRDNLKIRPSAAEAALNLRRLRHG